MSVMIPKRKYREPRVYKGTKAKGGGDDTRRPKRWFGKNAPKGAGEGR